MGSNLFSKINDIKLHNSISKKLLIEKYSNFEEFQFLSSFKLNKLILTNFLFYYAKMNCFFRKHIDYKGLKLASELIDINDWIDYVKNKKNNTDIL